MDLYLVCGSRDWPAECLWLVTAKMIELIPHGAAVLTGGARGVDRHAEKEARRLGWTTITDMANWQKHGKRAGFIRNEKMLDRGPKLVLAFHWNRSPGTAHTLREARRRGIPFKRFTKDDLRPDIAALDQDWEPIGCGW